MVASLFVYMGGSLGRGHAPSKASAEKNPRSRIYGSMRCSWIFVWDFVCTGAGRSLWLELSGDDSLDRGGPAMGLYSWYQQFFLRDINYASDFDIEIGRKERDGHSLGNVEVRR